MRPISEYFQKEDYSYHYEEPGCLAKMEQAIVSLITKTVPDFSREPVYLCIGTDRATGDCLGPLVGTLLKGLLPRANIFGTLENPAHAINLGDVIGEINRDFKSPLIVAIDACLGKPHRIGFINIKEGSIRPGTALQKVLPPVGDFHISGVVNCGGMLEHMVLQNTRLYIVYQMAEVIVRSLFLAHLRLEKLKLNQECS
ncbi:MAG: spore protease YyaC [Syntrophomonadaceae bacterium]